MDKNKRSLIYKISKDYYQKGETQQGIADRYGISRIMVSRLLSKALREKMVEIKVHPPDDPFAKLEGELEAKYNLKEVIIGSSSQSYLKILDELGHAGTNYLLRSLKGNELIGVSWGHTLLALVNALPKSNFPKIKIIQMIGGLGYPEDELSGNELVRRMANTFNSVPKLLNSPGIVAHKDICNALKNDLQIASTLGLAREADFSLVGIGYFSENTSLQMPNGILTKKDINELKKKGAVGDISLRFFNNEGELIDDEIHDRVVGICSDELKKIPRVVGIAGGEHKHATIKAALKGKLINVLITDKNTANSLMK